MSEITKTVGETSKIVSDSDYAAAKLMIVAREINNDAEFINASIGLLVISLARKENMAIKNVVILENGSIILNAEDNNTILDLNNKFKKE